MQAQDICPGIGCELFGAMPREFMRIHVQQVEVPVEVEDDATEGTPIPRWNINEVRV
jgi:hypothetical protein